MLAGQTEAMAVGQVVLGPAGIRVEGFGPSAAAESASGLGVVGLPGSGALLLLVLASVLDAPAYANKSEREGFC